MRKNGFNEDIVDSKTDDIGLLDKFQEASFEGVYALIGQDSVSGLWRFDILENESGEQVVESDAIFDTDDEVRKFLRGHVDDIQTNS